MTSQMRSKLKVLLSILLGRFASWRSTDQSQRPSRAGRFASRRRSDTGWVTAFLAPAASHLGAAAFLDTPTGKPYGIPATLAAIVAFFVIALGLMILVGHLRDRHRRR